MKPRIGLIADPQTKSEMMHVIDEDAFSIISPNVPTDIDAILYVQGFGEPSAQQDAEFEALMQNPNPGNDTLVAILGNKSRAKDIAANAVPVPSLTAFLQLAQLRSRQKRIRTEAALRRQSIRAFTPNIDHARPRVAEDDVVLFLGPPSSFFLRCVRDLRDAGRIVQSVLTEHSAFEFLRSRRPSAFVFAPESQRSPIELLDHIHGRSDLRQLPVIGVLEETVSLADIGDNVSAVVWTGENDTENLKRILNTLEASREEFLLENAAGYPDLSDRYSDVFSAAFAQIHLQAQLDWAKSSDTPHSVAVITPIDPVTGNSLPVSDLAKFANRIQATLRKEDFIARLGWHQFLVSMPHCRTEDAEQVMRRARSILESTACHSSERPTGFVFNVKTFSNVHTPRTFWSLLEATASETLKKNQASAVA